MKEAQLRTWHRNVGLVVFIFILFQALTGVVLTFEDIFGFYLGGIVHDLHKRYDMAGHIYRLISGTGMLWMAVTGMAVWMKIRARRKSR